MSRKSKSELIANHLVYLVNNLVMVQDAELSPETKRILLQVLTQIIRHHASEVQDRAISKLYDMLS